MEQTMSLRFSGDYLDVEVEKATESVTPELINSDGELLADTVTTKNAVASPVHPNIIWKAYFQTPIRLSESDAWPTGRPEFYGLDAPSPTLRINVDRSVQDYKSFLPDIFEEYEGRGRLDSKCSRMTIGAKSTFTGAMRQRRAQRFLKTIPSGLLQFPPLQRSVQFENFIRFRAEDASVDDSNPPEIPEKHNQIARPLFPEEPKNDDACKSQAASEFRSKRISYEHFDGYRASSILSAASLQSKLKRMSLFKKSLSKIGINFPLAPIRMTLYRPDSIIRQSWKKNSSRKFSDIVRDNLTDNSSIEQPKTEPQKDMSTRQRTHPPNLPPGLCPNIVDLDTFYTGHEILEAKVKEHDMKIPLKCESAKVLRQLYTVTILQHPMLKDLLISTRLDALPKPLRQLVRMGSMYNRKDQVDVPPEVRQALELQYRFCMTKEPQLDIALADVENLWIEAKVFTAELFSNWISRMQPVEAHGQLSTADFDILLRRVARSVRTNSTMPTSSARANLSKLLATGVAFPRHLSMVWYRLVDWMENLLGGLYSHERTVREETCYILAYIFTEPTLVSGIRQYPFYDLGYDVTTAVLHAMQVTPSSFLHFFCLLALMVEGCPMFSVLAAIMELGPSSGCVLLNHLWPRLIYYALKYWHVKQFSRDRMILKMLNESIERAYVAGISRKHAKLAQIQLSKRFKVLTKPTTIWLDEWKKIKV